MVYYMLLILIVCILLGIPIGFSIIISTIFYGIFNPDILIVIPQRMIAGANSFPLMAIPFFILTGELMNAGGLTDMFASMSGSAVADVLGLGLIEMEAMDKAGYDRSFSVGITIASSTLGPIIPPSINLVIYGSISGVSVGALFLGGIVPGLLIALSISILIYIISLKRNYPIDPPVKFNEIMVSCKDAFLSLITPFIIIGGILSGVFTPTEAAAIAVMYSLFLTFIVYRTLHLIQLFEILIRVSKNTAIIMLIISVSSAFGYILTRERIPQIIAENLFKFSENTIIIWLLILLFLFIVGFFIEVASAIIILTPILTPAVQLLNIDPIHFGVVMVLILGVGLITPPVGLCLYAGVSVSGLSLEKVVKATYPYILPMILTILFCTFIPKLVTFIPYLFY